MNYKLLLLLIIILLNISIIYYIKYSYKSKEKFRSLTAAYIDLATLR
jgi:hypothetical protein